MQTLCHKSNPHIWMGEDKFEEGLVQSALLTSAASYRCSYHIGAWKSKTVEFVTMRDHSMQ